MVNAITDQNAVTGFPSESSTASPFFSKSPKHLALTRIAPLSGTSGNAFGLNKLGVVVGQSANLAFIWQEEMGNTPRNLNNYKGTAVDTLWSAEAINDQMVIVGTAIQYGTGNYTAYILTPP